MGKMEATTLAFLILALVMLPISTGAQETDEGPKQPEGTRMLRFEFDNDAFVGTDNAFSAGWSLQYFSAARDTWNVETKDGMRKSPGAWFARWVPGLKDDGAGGRMVRHGLGLSQAIQTPEDISTTELQPDDIPYVGTLGLNATLQSFSDKNYAGAQLYVGCLGPCSGAEQMQKFVHNDLGMGEPPMGWDNQIDNTFLANLGYSARRKLASNGKQMTKKFAADLSVGGQLGLGNLWLGGDATIEARWGWGLPTGFTNIPDMPGRGVMMDSSPPRPLKGASLYFTLVTRGSWLGYTELLEGGDTQNGGYHPGIEVNNFMYSFMPGLHLAYSRFMLHLTYYYFPENVYSDDLDSSIDWVNVSLEYRW
jgi:lipid A 3-O-deacylase